MFIIRVREGLTATLKKRVLEKGATTVPTLVEGPYGAPPDITPFTTCIFVAGESHSTVVLAYLLNGYSQAVPVFVTPIHASKRPSGTLFLVD